MQFLQLKSSNSTLTTFDIYDVEESLHIIPQKHTDVETSRFFTGEG